MFKLNDLPKIGVFFTKAYPPHRGHLGAIINASTLCQKLYVVISYHEGLERKLAEEAGIEPISIALRKQWLSQELIDLNHIKVKVLDESNIPEYPNGWETWAKLMQETVGEEINEFFVGETIYVDKLQHYFPKCHVTLFDVNRTRFNISATEIRKSPLKHWDYILGSARSYFTKKILIAGTESSGKTTLTKELAKLYYTSWSEEVGRYYTIKFKGGDEEYYTDEDFTRIAHQQIEQDYDTLRHANKICFFDTDATATQYFSKLYMGHSNPIVEAYINPKKYDVVFLLTPDVEWIDDGTRLNGSQDRRLELHNQLKEMYVNKGFNVIEVRGNYNERLNIVTDYIDNNYV